MLTGSGRRQAFTLIELMIVIAIIAIIAAIAIPSILVAARTANENNASSSLKQFSNTQALFKTQDSDQNGTNDYWNADVRGFYYIATGTPTPIEIRHGEVSVALADGNPDPGADYTNPATAIGSPKAGYWFQQQTGYENPSGTGNAYGRRNSDRFSILAYPNVHGSSGTNIFILSEAGTMYKRNPNNQASYLATSPSTGSADPGGVLQGLYVNFPFNVSAASTAAAAGPWSKMD